MDTNVLTAIITIASLLFAGGCEKNKIGTDNKANPDIVDIGTSVTGHFINLYVIPDSISIGNTTYFDTDSTWTLIFKGDDITHQYKDSAMLRKLSESLGDTSYTEPTTPSYARAVAGTVYSVGVHPKRLYSHIRHALLDRLSKVESLSDRDRRNGDRH